MVSSVRQAAQPKTPEELKELKHEDRVEAIAQVPLKTLRGWCADLLADTLSTIDVVGDGCFQTNGDTECPQASLDTVRRLPPGFSVSLYSSVDIPRTYLFQCFSLLEHTSSEAYRNAYTGWDPDNKWAEMSHTGLKYLIVTETDDEGSGSARREPPVVGFLSFCPMEDAYNLAADSPVGAPVWTTFFIYEIHVWPKYQGRAIGSALLDLTVRMADRLGAVQLGLCVYDSNPDARRLYERHGYAIAPDAMNEEYVDQMMARVKARWSRDRDRIVRRGGCKREDGSVDDDRVDAAVKRLYGRTVREPGIVHVMTLVLMDSAAASCESA